MTSNDLPVMIVAGTPEEMGRQTAVLTGDVVKKLIDYPRKLVQRSGGAAGQIPGGSANRR